MKSYFEVLYLQLKVIWRYCTSDKKFICMHWTPSNKVIWRYCTFDNKSYLEVLSEQYSKRKSMLRSCDQILYSQRVYCNFHREARLGGLGTDWPKALTFGRYIHECVRHHSIRKWKYAPCLFWGWPQSLTLNWTSRGGCLDVSFGASPFPYQKEVYKRVPPNIFCRRYITSK